jgi:hypothetical protein
MVTLRIADHDYALIDNALRMHSQEMLKQAEACRECIGEEGEGSPLIGSYEAVARALQESGDASAALLERLQDQYEDESYP